MSAPTEQDRERGQAIARQWPFISDQQMLADMIAAALQAERERTRAEDARKAETYAAMVASQNDLSAPVENWSDFHKGQVYGAQQFAAILEAAQLPQGEDK